jgi:hypothetical protein
MKSLIIKHFRLALFLILVLTACHHYLFRRSDIEQLSPEKRRTAPQLGRDLGMSRSQIVQWVKDGKIKPVSGPGIDKSGHYLFTI